MFYIFYPAQIVSYLLCIETANPPYRHQQKAVADFYCTTLSAGTDAAQRKIRAVARNSGIHSRYSVLHDFTSGNQGYRFYPKNSSLEPFPKLDERMSIFQKEALILSLQAVRKIGNFEKIKDQVSHIITVTCTGLFAPGLDIELIRALGLKNNVQRSSVNFMGCNAAILALRQAHQICEAGKDNLVLIVCTELCTLHFQNEQSDDYILSNMLFGDGSAAALVGGRRLQVHKKYQPVKINTFYSLIVHEGEHDMAWRLSERGFIMNLSSYISELLNKNIAGMLSGNGIRPAAIRHWAIHPGGKKILDAFCSAMSLQKEHLRCSYDVLRDYGNMSSATILFVLKEMLSSKIINGKEKIYAAAFGPGLSIESVLMEHV
jgi:alpha-pyrone synthase